MNFQLAKELSLRLWLRRPNQASLPNCPVLVQQAEVVLSQFANRHCSFDPVAPYWTVTREVMDEFSSKGWERGAHMAILDLMQSPGVVVGVTLEGQEMLVAYLMTEKTISTKTETATAWKPQVGILSSTPSILNENLDQLIEVGLLIKDGGYLRYTYQKILGSG